MQGEEAFQESVRSMRNQTLRADRRRLLDRRREESTENFI